MKGRYRTATSLAISIAAGAGVGVATWRLQREHPRDAAPPPVDQVAAPTIARSVEPPTGGRVRAVEVAAASPAPAPEREEPRNDGWATGVETLLGEMVGERVHDLAPEVTWLGVECRSRGCTLKVECPIERERMCQLLASALVIVDGMVLRPRTEPSDDERGLLMLVDIELPFGDVEALRRAMALEQERHPEVLERLADSIEMIRRDDESVP